MADVEFVASAYLTLLRRPADIDGLEHYTRKLRAGSTKAEILALIHGSREGRSKGVELMGLRKALQRHKLSRLPVIGSLLRLFGNAEGHSPADRRLRAIEQHLLRQEVVFTQRHEHLRQELQALRTALAQGGGIRADASGLSSDQLIVQSRGQTPSILSRFIKLQRAPASEVMTQLAELVQSSLEAEQFATHRQ